MTTTNLFIKFTPTKADYIRGYRAYAILNRGSWLLSGFLAIFIIFIIIASFRFNLWDSSFVRIFVGIGILIPTLNIFIFPSLQANRLIKNDRFTSEVSWEVSEEEIHTQASYAESRYDWATYKYVMENSDLFILTYADLPNVIQIIPKRAFESQDQLSKFRSLLSQNDIHAPSIKPAGRSLSLLLFLLLFMTVMCLVLFNYSQRIGS